MSEVEDSPSKKSPRPKNEKKRVGKDLDLPQKGRDYEKAQLDASPKARVFFGTLFCFRLSQNHPIGPYQKQSFFNIRSPREVTTRLTKLWIRKLLKDLNWTL